MFTQRRNRTYAEPIALKSATGRPVNVGDASAVAVWDWNHDGLRDLIVGELRGSVKYLRNIGEAKTPEFASPRSVNADGDPIVAPGGDSGPSVADWDQDGRMDLLMGSGSGAVHWYRNLGPEGEPRFEAGRPLVSAPDSSADLFTETFDDPKRPGIRTKVSVADWNGDGLPDLIVGDFSYLRVGDRSRNHGWVWVYPRMASGSETRD